MLRLLLLLLPLPHHLQISQPLLCPRLRVIRRFGRRMRDGARPELILIGSLGVRIVCGSGWRRSGGAPAAGRGVLRCQHQLPRHTPVGSPQHQKVVAGSRKQSDQYISGRPRAVHPEDPRAFVEPVNRHAALTGNVLQNRTEIGIVGDHGQRSTLQIHLGRTRRCSARGLDFCRRCRACRLVAGDRWRVRAASRANDSISSRLRLHRPRGAGAADTDDAGCPAAASRRTRCSFDSGETIQCAATRDVLAVRPCTRLARLQIRSRRPHRGCNKQGSPLGAGHSREFPATAGIPSFGSESARPTPLDSLIRERVGLAALNRYGERFRRSGNLHLSIGPVAPRSAGQGECLFDAKRATFSAQCFGFIVDLGCCLAASSSAWRLLRHAGADDASAAR